MTTPDEMPVAAKGILAPPADHQVKIKLGAATVRSLTRALAQLACLDVPASARVEILPGTSIFAAAQLRASWKTPIPEVDDA